MSLVPVKPMTIWDATWRTAFIVLFFILSPFIFLADVLLYVCKDVMMGYGAIICECADDVQDEWVEWRDLMWDLGRSVRAMWKSIKK